MAAVDLGTMPMWRDSEKCRKPKEAMRGRNKWTAVSLSCNVVFKSSTSQERVNPEETVLVSYGPMDAVNIDTAPPDW